MEAQSLRGMGMANLCAVKARMGKAGLGHAPVAGYLASLYSVLGSYRVLELMMFLEPLGGIRFDKGGRTRSNWFK